MNLTCFFFVCLFMIENSSKFLVQSKTENVETASGCVMVDGDCLECEWSYGESGCEKLHALPVFTSLYMYNVICTLFM